MTLIGEPLVVKLFVAVMFASWVWAWLRMMLKWFDKRDEVE